MIKPVLIGTYVIWDTARRLDVWLTSHHHADNMMVLKRDLEKITPISWNEPITPTLKHYLLNATRQ